MNTTQATTKEWNPRYVAYARSNGNTPDAQLAADKVRFPGGCMCEFIIWNGRQLHEFRSQFKKHPTILTEQDHAEYDAWLNARTA